MSREHAGWRPLRPRSRDSNWIPREAGAGSGRGSCSGVISMVRIPNCSSFWRDHQGRASAFSIVASTSGIRRSSSTRISCLHGPTQISSTPWAASTSWPYRDAFSFARISSPSAAVLELIRDKLTPSSRWVRRMDLRIGILIEARRAQRVPDSQPVESNHAQPGDLRAAAGAASMSALSEVIDVEYRVVSPSRAPHRDHYFTIESPKG